MQDSNDSAAVASASNPRAFDPGMDLFGSLWFAKNDRLGRFGMSFFGSFLMCVVLYMLWSGVKGFFCATRPGERCYSYCKWLRSIDH